MFAAERMAMRQLLRKLVFGGTRRFRDYELTCIVELRKKLPPDCASRLEAQLADERWLLQRSAKDRMVIFDFSRDQAGLTLMPNTEPELRVATVTLGSGSAANAIKCDIVFHRGRISSLEFSDSPSHLRDAT